MGALEDRAWLRIKYSSPAMFTVLTTPISCSHRLDNGALVNRELIVADFGKRYGTLEPNRFDQLYLLVDEPFDSMFALFHERLNELFGFMNTKADQNLHYNAGPSRELLDLIVEMAEAEKVLARIGLTFSLTESYAKHLDYSKTFLVGSGGSAIPDNYRALDIEAYEPIFEFTSTQIKKASSSAGMKLEQIGEGAFARVFRFFDPDYQRYMAIKQVKATVDARGLARFRDEFETLKRLSFPYILDVYTYRPDNDSYVMDYCETTLTDHIRNNPTTLFPTRKRIAQQVLYAMNYLHAKKIWHRDISTNNILLKKYDMNAVLVKISDLGLHKDARSSFTRTGSLIKGTIIDATLDDFKNYSTTHEIYSLGAVLSYIFSGSTNPMRCDPGVRRIVEKCMSIDQQARFSSVLEIIAAIEDLDPPSNINQLMTESPT